MAIGEVIRELREARGMRQGDLADKAGMSKQLLYKYESNIITNVPSDRLESIARALNVSPGYIMG